MSGDRQNDYVDHIRQAVSDACSFVAGMSKEDFLLDKRTQQAVVMNLIIIGEAAAKLMDRYPEVVARHPDLPWRSMRGMRNRIAHGYFELDLNIVWDTVRIALPDLERKLALIP